MEFWNSSNDLVESEIHNKMSSDDDDILKHVQNLDIGDNFMDDDDIGESYDTDDHARDTAPGGRAGRPDGVVNGDYPDDLSDISDLFENDAHLLSLDIGSLTAGVVKNREVQMLSLDEVPYSRDLKWINTPEDDRPKPRISKTSNRFLRQVQGITSQNLGELNELDRHYKGLDQRKKVFDLSGPPLSRDRRRGRQSGSLVEVQSAHQLETQADALATRGPGKLVIFDDDPRPSQRRKRPHRPRPPKGEARGGERDSVGDSKERREKSSQYNHKGETDGGSQHPRSLQRSNGSAAHVQPSRLHTHNHSDVRQGRHEVLAIQTRAFTNRPGTVPAPATMNVPLNQQSGPCILAPPIRQQRHLISENNAIKLRADAPAWTPLAYGYT